MADNNEDEVIPQGWEKRTSRSNPGMVYYLNIYTKGKFTQFSIIDLS
jgi:hypothetical protein